jgi:hypothetical protein
MLNRLMYWFFMWMTSLFIVSACAALILGHYFDAVCAALFAGLGFANAWDLTLK